jgi:hypothetical protein
MTTDPRVYPIAKGFVPFGARVRLTGQVSACVAPAEDCNATAQMPSAKGDEIGWQDGETMRVLPDAAQEERKVSDV